MDLASHQRILLGLIRSTYEAGAEDSPYIHAVAKSRDLEEARRNIYLWRVYVLERSCLLTMTLLRQRGQLESVLADFTQQNLSPFRETQGPAFLDALRHHADHLTASVAGFELALLKVAKGDPCAYRVAWAIDPHPVLHSLCMNHPIDEGAPEEGYEIIVSRELPELFEISRKLRG